MVTELIIYFRLPIANFKSAIGNRQSLKAVWFVAAQWKIFPQRVSLPIVRQQNATQIRVAVEDHAKQIKRLAFVPVRGAPNSGDTRHVRVFLVQQHLQTNSMVLSG